MLIRHLGRTVGLLRIPSRVVENPHVPKLVGEDSFWIKARSRPGRSTAEQPGPDKALVGAGEHLF